METLVYGWLYTLGDATVKATLLLALAALITLIARRASASFRHLVWALSLGCALSLPFLSLSLPHWLLRVTAPVTHSRPAGAETLPPTDTQTTDPPQAAPQLAASDRPSAPAAIPIKTAPPNTSIKPQTVVPRPFRSRFPMSLSRPFWALLIWGTGVVFVLVRLLRGVRWLTKIARASLSANSGPFADVLAGAATSMRLKRPIELRQARTTAQVSVPITWGAWHPIIILPAEAGDWSEGRTRAAVLHELAHVRRWDWLLQMLAYLACALYWFNPLVWLAARKMRAESETACDDLVLAAGMPAADYARHLLDVALCARDGRQISAGAVAMARTSKVEWRLRTVLDAGLSRQEVTRQRRAAAILMALCLVTLTAACRLSARKAMGPAVSESVATFIGPSISPDAIDRFAQVARWSNPRVRLANGATVELLGIGKWERNHYLWQKSVRSPRSKDLPKNSLVFSSLPAGTAWHSFAVTTTYDVTSQPQSIWATAPNSLWATTPYGHSRGSFIAKPTVTWVLEPDEHIKEVNFFQGQETRSGQQATEMDILPLAVHDSTQVANVKLGVAAGSWTRTVTCPRRQGVTRIKTPWGDVIFTLQTPKNSLGGRQKSGDRNVFFSVSDPFGSDLYDPHGGSFADTNNYDRDVVALDSTGRIVYDLRGGTGPSAEIHGGIVDWTNLPNSSLRKVTAFRLVARPFQWAEFRDVPLQPRATGTTSLRPSTVPQEQPDTAAAHIALGLKLQQQGQPRDGIPEFRQAVQADPNNAEAQYWLAYGLYEIKWKHFVTAKSDTTVTVPPPPAVLDEVILHMQRAVALRPNHPQWHSTLGTYLANRGRDAEAVTEFRRALHLLLALTPFDLTHGESQPLYNIAQITFDAHSSLGDSLLKLRQYPAAIQQFQQALQFYPASDSVLLGLGDALNGNGQRAEARAAWRKVVALDPPADYDGGQARARLAKH